MVFKRIGRIFLDTGNQKPKPETEEVILRREISHLSEFMRMGSHPADRRLMERKQERLGEITGDMSKNRRK